MCLLSTGIKEKVWRSDSIALDFGIGTMSALFHMIAQIPHKFVKHAAVYSRLAWILTRLVMQYPVWNTIWTR